MASIAGDVPQTGGRQIRVTWTTTDVLTYDDSRDAAAADVLLGELRAWFAHVVRTRQGSATREADSAVVDFGQGAEDARC